MESIKLVQYYKSGNKLLGLCHAKEITPLPFSFEEVVSMVMDHKEKEIHSSIKNSDSKPEKAPIHYAPCVPPYCKIIGVGLNYKSHIKESGLPIPKFPVLFSKFGNTLSAHLEDVVLPSVSKEFDYEGELGVIIGRKAKNISVKKTLDYVLGYCNANDLSSRDLQFRTPQGLVGKNLNGFCPIGPYIVTREEVKDPNNLMIKTYVNGAVRQQSNTNDMVFNVEEIVSYVSHYMTLEPGDIILTGTPAGVILGQSKEKRNWLKAGDQVTVEIEKLGSLTNRLVNED